MYKSISELKEILSTRFKKIAVHKYPHRYYEGKTYYRLIASICSENFKVIFLLERVEDFRLNISGITEVSGNEVSGYKAYFVDEKVVTSEFSNYWFEYKPAKNQVHECHETMLNGRLILRQEEAR